MHGITFFEKNMTNDGLGSAIGFRVSSSNLLKAY